MSRSKWPIPDTRSRRSFVIMGLSLVIPWSLEGIGHWSFCDDPYPHPDPRPARRPPNRLPGRDGGVPPVGPGMGVLRLVADGPVAGARLRPGVAVAAADPKPAIRGTAVD